MTPKNPARLDRQSAAGPYPAGRYADPAPFPPGDGERTLPEQMAGWSYHVTEGFKMTDFPLGNPAPRSLTEGLKANDFSPSPSRVIGTGEHRLEVYDRLTTAEFLVVVHSAGLEQLVVAKGFPSMMDLLKQWGPVVEKCAGGGPPPHDAVTRTAAGDRYSVIVDQQLAGSGLTLQKALSTKPKFDPAVITREGSPIALYVWDGDAWVATSQAEALPATAARPPAAAREDGGNAEPRYRVVSKDRRLLAEGVTLKKVMGMSPMPHDCHGAEAHEVGAAPGSKPAAVYSGPEGKWIQPD